MQLQQCSGLLQTLLFSYSARNGFQSEYEVLTNIWKALSDEETERITDYDLYEKYDYKELWLGQNRKQSAPPALIIPVVTMKPKLRKGGLI